MRFTSVAPREFLVGGGDYDAALIYTAVAEDVLVVLSVDDRNPEFRMHHQPFVDNGGSAERDFVPASGVETVAAVAFMFEHKGHLPDVAVFAEKGLARPMPGLKFMSRMGIEFWNTFQKVF